MKAAIWVALAVTGCASNAPSGSGLAAAQYQREAAAIEAVEAFEQLKEACTRAGGVVHVRRRGAWLTTVEMRSARCVPRGTIARFF